MLDKTNIEGAFNDARFEAALPSTKYSAKCLELKIVRGTPGAVQALKGFFDSDSYTFHEKRALSSALNGFASRLEAKKVASLAGATSDDVNSYLATIKDQSKRRSSLRRAFDLLAEHGILPKDCNPVPRLKL